MIAYMHGVQVSVLTEHVVRRLTMSKLHKPIEADFGHLQKPFDHIWWFASEFLHLKQWNRHIKQRNMCGAHKKKNKQTSKTKPKKSINKSSDKCWDPFSHNQFG